MTRIALSIRLTFKGKVRQGNGVSLYSYSAYSLANGPLLLDLDPYDGGYWLISFYDIYGLTHYSFGSAHGNNAGGKWLLVPHGWEGQLPEDWNGTLIYSPTVEGSILGRTSFNGTGAVAWRASWRLGPWAPAAKPVIRLPPVGSGFGYPDQDPGALNAVNAADPLAFWRLAGDIYRRNGNPALPTPLADQLEKLGIFRDYGFLPSGLNQNVTDALAYAPVLANRILVAKYIFLGSPAQNYWHLPIYNGAWGNDYVLGAAIMKGFWVSNFLVDAAYYYNYLDSEGVPYNGSYVYHIEFPAPPPARNRAFWSIQALNLDEWTPIFGPNLVNQALSSATPGLYIAKDGSVPVRIQPNDPPANTTAASRGWNWVKGYSGRFHLILRIYSGAPEVLTNTYVPPPVVKLGLVNSTAPPSPLPLASPFPPASGFPSPAPVSG
ncbi:hypothetical protein GPECTOR_16g641 [Gonium pectorale]|uniref:DUF1254 domain-containing protein n=1 Tax=Gonium pectorale TaxID=33097 RepID=A0A150GL05_GONPE|nr:hypothetical protein GPECTOR_16g641 [Gonium pectorale]|eukprot:KXZ50467.1 hypothetical protein GPECTOR_16g641 [Gonium pectorale]